MQIDRVDTLDHLDLIKPDWETIYSEDAQAHIFLSWAWIRSWFEIAPYDWMVLAVRDTEGKRFVAFLPLIFRGLRIAKFRPLRTVNLGGQPLAPYTGFICCPEKEKEAISSLANYIQQDLTWVRIQLAEVLDPRLDIFLNSFSDEIFTKKKSYGMPSLYVPLPNHWTTYLQQTLSYNSRRKLLRRTRQLQALPGYYEYNIRTEENMEVIDTILNLWQARWGPKPTANWLREIFGNFLQLGQLWATILMDSHTPIGGTVSLIDNKKKIFYAYIFGGNPSYKKWTPGKVMCGYEIKYAIENGFEKYDFLVGADEYKFSFGSKKRDTFNIIITPKRCQANLANKLLEFTNQAGDLLKRYLGKLKRLKVVKWVWFSLFSRVRK